MTKMITATQGEGRHRCPSDFSSRSLQEQTQRDSWSREPLIIDIRPYEQWIISHQSVFFCSYIKSSTGKVTKTNTNCSFRNPLCFLAITKTLLSAFHESLFKPGVPAFTLIRWLTGDQLVRSWDTPGEQQDSCKPSRHLTHPHLKIHLSQPILVTQKHVNSSLAWLSVTLIMDYL